jgi:hypothetical protein
MMAASGRVSTFAGAAVEEPLRKKAKRTRPVWYLYVLEDASSWKM